MLSGPGNFISYASLVFWPVFSLWLYRNKSIQTATVLSILCGYMFLPVRTVIDFPVLPPLGKDSVAVLAALFGAMLVQRRRVSLMGDKRTLEKWLILLLLTLPVFSVLTNGESFIIGGRFLPALTIRDSISLVFGQFILIIPFAMGRQFFRSYESQLQVFKVIVVAGLIYSIAILYEIRMSPQLHRLVYDYFPHSFLQQKRGGGFRAVVFMGHGLWVAFFVMVTLSFATALSKIGENIRNISTSKISYYFFIVLLLCKSLGAFFLGVFAFYLIKFTKVKLQMRLAGLLAVLALVYPVMSITNLFPHEQVIELAGSISEERAASLRFRFDNEYILLSHAREKIIFGWGGWGRNRVYNEETGRDESVTDGEWIITLSQFGAVGFIAEFGLLAISVFRAKKAIVFLSSKREQVILAAHALFVSLLMVDQIPNSSLSPWLWLLAGVLLGRSESIINENEKKSLRTIGLRTIG